MNWAFYLFIGVVAAMFMFQLYIERRAKRAEGQSAPDTAAVDGEAHAMARRVYYFYAPHCGPCRAMVPMMERMQAAHRNLIRVNVEESPDIARSFGIAGTPSFVRVEDGVIREVLLGAQSERKLKKLLEVAD